ncbi:hypothetical protein RUND412_011408 [Rhizina undulata]
MATIQVEQDTTAQPANTASSPSQEYWPEEPGFKITTQMPAPLFGYEGEFKATVVENEEGTLTNNSEVYVFDLNGQKHILKIVEFSEPTDFTRSINLETRTENPPKVMSQVKSRKASLKIHDAYILHGDIDAHNILITPGRIVWIDFDRAGTYNPMTYPGVTPDSFKIEKSL